MMKAHKRIGGILTLVGVMSFLLPGNLVSCTSQISSPAPESVLSPVTPVSVTISPEESYNPVMTQHTMVARVLAEGGVPAEGVTVEWMLNRSPDAVGDIVSGYVAESDAKQDNTYAITKTDANGEAMLTITATRPGDTDITALVSAIQDPARHKVFATKHWLNLQVQWPGDAVNMAGTDHVFTTKVMTVSTETQLPGYPPGWTSIRRGVGKGLPGYSVRWTIIDDNPQLCFVDGNRIRMDWMSISDDRGMASATVRQLKPASGDNTILIEVLAPDGVPMFQHRVTKNWTSPVLQLTKTGPDSVVVGSNLTYHLTLRNTGDGDATRVLVRDTIPEGLTYVSAEPQASVSGKEVSWTLSRFSPGSSVPLTLTLKAASAGQWTNIASVTSAEGLEAEASATIRVVAPSVKIEKTGPTAVYVPENADYLITVENTGDTVLNDVTVTDTIPQGMSFVNSTIENYVTGITVTWNLGRMNPGETKRFGITLKSEQRGSWTNVATVTTKEGSTDQSQQKTLVLAEAGVTISSTDTVDPIAVGEQTTYHTMVTNQGIIDVHNLVVADTLPGQVQLVNATGPTSYSSSGGIVTFQPVSVLRSGQSLVYEVTVKAISKGSALNRVILTFDEFEAPVAVEEGTTIYKIE
ncbi:MAG: DUF11 domain-containing protein [Dehalococcoidales bacterium]|nr:DUF11 domain-containing protein [Dehalococcoidales bacterium]